MEGRLWKAGSGQERTLFYCFMTVSGLKVCSADQWFSSCYASLQVLFELARYHAPSTIFLDELESVMSQRGVGQGWARAGDFRWQEQYKTTQSLQSGHSKYTIQCLGVVDICQEDIECFWLDLCYSMYKNTIVLNQLMKLLHHFYFVLLRGDHEGSRRMKTELLVQMDGLARSNDLVFVLAASNLPWWGVIARKLY